MKKLAILLLIASISSCAKDRTQEGDASVYKAFLYPYIGKGEAALYVSKYSDTHFFTENSKRKIKDYFDEKSSEYSTIIALSKSADEKSDVTWKNSQNVIFVNVDKQPCNDNLKEIVSFSKIHYSDDGTLAYFTHRKLCTSASDSDASFVTLRKAEASCTDINLGFSLCTDWVMYSQSYINGI